MKLTGKAKEDFDKWFIVDFRIIENDHWAILELNKFYRLHYSMQWGIYQDFFYESGIDIITRFKDGRFISYAAPHEKNDEFYRATEHKEREEARATAIEKANEIYNSK